MRTRPATNVGETFPRIRSRRESRKDDKGDARGEHTDKGGGRVLPEPDLREAERVIEQVERKKRDEAREGDDLPSVLLDCRVEPLPSRAFELPLDPLAGEVAADEEGNARAGGCADYRVDDAPHGSEEDAPCDGEGQPRQKQGRGDRVDEHVDDGRKDAVPRDQAAQRPLVHVPGDARRPDRSDGGGEKEQENDELRHAALLLRLFPREGAPPGGSGRDVSFEPFLEPGLLPVGERRFCKY